MRCPKHREVLLVPRSIVDEEANDEGGLGPVRGRHHVELREVVPGIVVDSLNRFVCAAPDVDFSVGKRDVLQLALS